MSGPLQGDYRGSISKGGPRVLTFIPTSFPATLNNCPSCDGYDPAQVLGEDYVGGDEPGVGGVPLVHGWYQIVTEVDIYWQQVNPEDACDTEPFFTGLSLAAGGCITFFVDEARRDGIIVVWICEEAELGACVSGYVRVNRRDTIRTMAQTGENAELKSAPASSACGTQTCVAGTDD